jgi:hypothetical protein
LKEHRLIQILKTFTKAEFAEFKKFADSPFHNGGRNYAPFIKELKKYHPAYKNWDEIKARIFSKASVSHTNTTLSRVLKLAEEYLHYKANRKQNVASRYIYIQELFARNLFHIAAKEMEEYSKLVHLSEGITDELIKGRMDYEILNVQMSFKNDKMLESTKSALNQADYHIKFTLMRLAHFLHNLRVNNIMFNAEYDKTFIRSYLEALNLEHMYNTLEQNRGANELDDIMLIYVTWILGLTDTGNEKYYFKMKEAFFRHIDKFHHHEKYNLIQALEGLAWLMQQEVNREKFELEFYDLSRQRVERNILSPDNTYMRIILFRSILIVSFYKPDWDFIERFVSRCVPLLREEHRENMYNFAQAHIKYHRGKFEEALHYNNKINFELFAFKYDTRILQMKIYYELSYFDEAYSLIDAHKHFVATNKNVSGYYKEMNTNFITFYSELLKLKQGISKTAPGLLKKKIMQTNNIPSKQFLLDKVRELE